MDPGVTVAVGYVDVAVGPNGDTRRVVERTLKRGHPGCAQGHDYLPVQGALQYLISVPVAR